MRSRGYLKVARTRRPKVFQHFGPFLCIAGTVLSDKQDSTMHNTTCQDFSMQM
jgi:hypothetical protein